MGVDNENPEGRLSGDSITGEIFKSNCGRTLFKPWKNKHNSILVKKSERNFSNQVKNTQFSTLNS